jgi:hypothetical protein
MRGYGGGWQRQWCAWSVPALPRELLCSFRHWSGRAQHRSGLPRTRGLTLPSRGRPQAGFAHLRPPLMSNVRRRYARSKKQPAKPSQPYLKTRTNIMCPLCLATIALMTAGATSTGMRRARCLFSRSQSTLGNTFDQAGSLCDWCMSLLD